METNDSLKESKTEIETSAPKKKKINGMVFGLVALGLVAALSAGFGIYEYTKNVMQEKEILELKQAEIELEKADNIESEVTNESNSFSDISLSDVRTILSDFIKTRYDVGFQRNIAENSIDEIYKYYLTFQHFNYLDRVSKADDYNGKYEFNFTYDEVNEVYHNLFGSSSDLPIYSGFTKDDPASKFICGIPFYSDDDGTYVSSINCGGTTPYSYYYSLLDYNITGDKLRVDIAWVVFDAEDKTIELDNGDKIYLQNGSGITLNDKYADKLPKYRLTFEREGENIIFTDLAKI